MFGPFVLLLHALRQVQEHSSANLAAACKCNERMMQDLHTPLCSHLRMASLLVAWWLLLLFLRGSGSSVFTAPVFVATGDGQDFPPNNTSLGKVGLLLTECLVEIQTATRSASCMMLVQVSGDTANESSGKQGGSTIWVGSRHDPLAPCAVGPMFY